jgi:hypothetical protein
MRPLHEPLHGEDDCLWIGWKWFEYHAKQRLEMFKFFITIYGATIAVAAGFLETSFILASAVLSFVGVMLSAVFWQLDRRSLQLIEVGERVLTARWDEVGFDKDLNPVRQSQTKHEDGVRFKHALLLVFLGAALLGFALFITAIYLTHYPISNVSPKPH